MGDEGRAVGVEHIPELVEQSIKNIQSTPVAANLLASGSLSVHVGGRILVLAILALPGPGVWHRKL